MYAIYFIIMCIIVHLFIIYKTNYVYDLTCNRTCNYFEIYNIDDLCNKISVCPIKIQIDDYLPECIKIDVFQDKGWGLVSKKTFKNGDIIYKSLIGRFPEVDSITLISKEHGIKNIEKDIHCGEITRKHDLFTYYDCLLNHSNEPNAQHENNLLVDNGSIYVVLKANRDISVGEELTINYIYLQKYVYYMNSYIEHFLHICHS